MNPNLAISWPGAPPCSYLGGPTLGSFSLVALPQDPVATSQAGCAEADFLADLADAVLSGG